MKNFIAMQDRDIIPHVSGEKLKMDLPLERVLAARAAITGYFISGRGIEVGAGSRPFPVPDGVEVEYGDIRGTEELKTYFNSLPVIGGKHRFDAQSMHGIAKNSLDFVLSGHVIEHLKDPVGSIVATVSVLRPSGVFVLAVPDMRLTFDRNRPETSVEHCLKDFQDGGLSTVKEAFEEHLRFCHPIMTGNDLSASEIEWQSSQASLRPENFDLHYHAWTMQGFEAVLQACQNITPMKLEFAIPIENENIFVIRKN